MSRKITHRFLILALVLCLLPIFCFDAGATNNNSKGEAERIYSGSTVSERIGGEPYVTINGVWTVDDRDDWFYFRLDKESAVTVSLTCDDSDIQFQIHNANGALSNPDTSYSKTLTAGTYYIRVSNWNTFKGYYYYNLSFDASPVCTHSDYSYKVIGATCYVEGYTRYTCNDCGYSWNGNYVGYVHPYGNWSTVSKPTCTENGLRERYCTNCGYRDTQTISATGHTCTDWKVSREPSCVDEGIESAFCVTCGHEDTRTFSALGHSYGEWTTTREATCTVQGVKTQTCTRCKHKNHETTPLVEHTFGEWIITSEATCTESASQVRFCQECGFGESGKGAGPKHNYTKIELTKVEDDAALDGSLLVVYKHHCGTCGTVTTSPLLGVSTHITIDEGTTHIPDNIFKDYHRLQRVTIPDSVTYIGDYAFSGCSNLETVNIGSGVKYIGSYAFCNTGIETITVPEGVTKIQDYTFSSCFYLRKVNLPNGITSIGKNAFSGCFDLSSIILPLNLESIGDNAFNNTEIRRVVFPQSVKKLGDYVFPSSIQRITISGAIPSHVGSGSAFGTSSANVYYKFPSGNADSYSNYGLGKNLKWIACNHDEKNPRTCASPTTCKNCGALGTLYYMPDHTYSGGTCTEPGVCTVCGKVDTESIGHDFGEYVISEATCTKNEVKSATCERCGEADTVEITGTALGHDFANYSSNNDAKCNLDGTKSATCTHCDVKNTILDSGSAKNHAEVWLDSKSATCSEKGLTSGKKCSLCDEMTVAQQVIPAAGHKYEAVVTDPTVTEQGYTTHTCSVCGDSYVDSYVDPIPAHPDVELPVVNVQLARMILGNELAMQFAFKAAPIVDGVDYVVSITKTYADGRPDVNVEVPEAQWVSTTSGGQPYFYVSFNGIAAKEMGDEIRVQIMTADGTPVGDVYTSSVMNYAVTQLRKTSVAVTRTLYVDLLNYGAAAQTYFKYDDQNLVNADLTETEKGYATKTIELENNLIKGTGYSASQLDLGSSILLRVRFNGIDSSMHAVVSFTNHTGRKIESRIEGDQFLYSGTVVVIDDVVAADYAQDVTVKVYDANGNEVANAVESVASYLARQLDKDSPLAIYDAVAKYCASAYAYLHR